MKKMEPSVDAFVERFRRSNYVDDVATNLVDVDTAYELLHLAKASFNLRKFETNSTQLHQRIVENELKSHKQDGV